MQIGELVAFVIELLSGGGGGAATAAPATTVTQIKAKVKGTRGVRKASDARPDDTLTSSNSNAKSLAGNAPVILVRGCNDVELEAVTNPPNQPVTWRVESNENKDAPPAILIGGGGRTATLKTNVHGSFSVIAEVGASKVIWNVVFVWVKVLTNTSVVRYQSHKYADAGSSAAVTRFRSGQFTAGQYAWRARVDVKVVGGGNSKKLGSDRVKVHVLQNGIVDTLTGNYTPAGTALEVPKGGVPVVDASGSGSPFIVVPSCFKITPNQTAWRRKVWTGDSPAGGFLGAHKNIAARLGSISGVNRFVTTIASVSDQAPNSIVVHAKIVWTADFSGTVSAAGIYARSGANTTSAKRYQRISNATGGQDAFKGGIETFEPRFNGGTNTTWNP
jgi:hypothetical protein